MKVLLHPTYFPSISSFAVLVQCEVVWEVADNYQKQTYRNRCCICTDQGKLNLTIPIKHVGRPEGRQRYAEVKPDNRDPWKRQHWRSLQTAYRTSPFFEFYEDELAPLFESPPKLLLDFNLRTIETLCSCLQLPFPEERTTVYEKSPEGYLDGRSLVDAKLESKQRQEEYNQVFGDRHGFIENLSILDLLFNLGPQTTAYLQEQKINL